MNEVGEFQRQQWFSPAFPVGGYAYSHGLEMAVATADVSGPASLTEWVEDLLRLGTGRNDAILLGESWRCATTGSGEARLDQLRLLANLGIAFGLSSERRLETCQQGVAFFALITRSWPHPDLPNFDDLSLPYPVAVGIAGGVHQQPLLPLARAYLQAFASNLIAAGIRLAVIGQSEAQVRMASLHPVISETALLATHATLDDVGGCAFRADLMALRHETLETRLFRS